MTWFSALGAPLQEAERIALDGYLDGLGLRVPVRAVASWEEAAELCRQPSAEWWRAEEAERSRLEQGTRLDPADAQWLELNAALHQAAARAAGGKPGMAYAAAGAASYAAYHSRLAQAAGAPATHPFHLKYALYCAGHWPLGVYHSQFRIF